MSLGKRGDQAPWKQPQTTGKEKMGVGKGRKTLDKENRE
jgi:hypothetical protein